MFESLSVASFEKGGLGTFPVCCFVFSVLCLVWYLLSDVLCVGFRLTSCLLSFIGRVVCIFCLTVDWSTRSRTSNSDLFRMVKTIEGEYREMEQWNRYRGYG